jgi:serine/threonine-protein kinase
MLYEMATGRVPFDGDTTVAVALKHVQEEMVPPSEINPNVPVSLEKIILKCTQKKTEKRYDNATELIADLKKALVTPYDDFVEMSNGNIGGVTRMIPADKVKEEFENTSKRQQTVSRRNSHSDENDGEREENSMDKLIMWLGIAIAVVAVVAAVFVMTKLFSVLNGMSGTLPGSDITKATVTVEADDGKVVMPNLVGYTEEMARETLKSYGLGFKRAKDYSDLFQEGYVMEQSIESGTRVLPNTTIVVTISEGVKTFELTDVTGLEENVARQVLEDEYHLTVSPEYVYDDAIEQGLVVSTMPIAGENVSAGDTITLKISRGPEVTEVPVPDIRGLDESAAREKLDAYGLVPVAAGSEYSDKVAEGCIISQSYADGKKVPSGTQIEYVVSLGSNNTGVSSNVTYTGQIAVDNAWFDASRPEDFDDEYGVVEFRVVVHQTSGGKDYSSVPRDYLNVNVVGFPYTVSFEGPAKGVNTATVDVYVRYTWQDENRQSQQIEKNVRSLTVTLTEAN